jgi:hypothetical protein
MLLTTNWLDTFWDGSLDTGAVTTEPLMVPDDPSAIGEIQAPDASTPYGGLSIASSETGTSAATKGEQRLGEFYVDGQPARLPRIKKRRVASSMDEVIHRKALTLRWQPPETWGPQAGVELSDEDYATIVTTYKQLCIADKGFELPSREEVPSKRLLIYLLEAYWEGFDAILPVVHRSPIIYRPSTDTIIAMCAVGGGHSEAPLNVVAAMYDFASRAVEHSTAPNHPLQVQASAIHARLLLFVMDAYSLSHAEAGAARPHRSIRSIFLDAEQGYRSFARSCAANKLGWDQWLQREQWSRLAHCAWLLDSMHASHIQQEPDLSLHDNDLPLPCHETVWQAAVSTQSEAQNNPFAKASSLLQALQGLYVEKRLPQETGEFARILVVHGLCHRLREVERYFSSPLSSWEPTATRQASADILPKEPIWLPAVSVYAKWQNSTCDALDVLHWQANATIGSASGLEHPTVLHLHLARIILLAPCGSIVRLARTLVQGREAGQVDSTRGDQKLVKRWAVQHQYKARLAVIHAGVLLWHVRRYSTDAFYEAPSVALASLTLWAFGTLAERRTTPKSSRIQSPAPISQHDVQAPTTLGTGNNGVDDEAPCEIILLDRPTDDELVQQFIRDGHSMQAHLGGVGNLYARTGPRRVLVQGVKLISSLKRWGISTGWLQLLESLAGTLDAQ